MTHFTVNKWQKQPNREDFYSGTYGNSVIGDLSELWSKFKFWKTKSPDEQPGM